MTKSGTSDSQKVSRSAPTRGRTLDHAARVYDWVEPVFMLGHQARYDQQIVSLVAPEPGHRVLDLGCGTGTLTRAIADRLQEQKGGVAIGIDAAAKMIDVAQKKRAMATCRFEVAAAETLPFEDASFDAVVSSLFFHHVPLDLKEKSIREAHRVLKPGGVLVVADMHTPSSVFGSLVSHIARWLLIQPEIGENIRGVLPGLFEKAGFDPPRLNATHFGYIAVFSTRKPALEQ